MIAQTDIHKNKVKKNNYLPLFFNKAVMSGVHKCTQVLKFAECISWEIHKIRESTQMLPLTNTWNPGGLLNVGSQNLTHLSGISQSLIFWIHKNALYNVKMNRSIRQITIIKKENKCIQKYSLWNINNMYKCIHYIDKTINQLTWLTLCVWLPL